MNFNTLVYTAADYKIAISYNGVTAPLSIVEGLDWGSKREHEYVHVVGSTEPVALKTNTSTYPGKLSIEAGELETFLILAGKVMATDISDATISIVALSGVFVKILKNVVVTSHDASIKAKDKRSLVSLSFECIGVNSASALGAIIGGSGGVV